MADGRAKRMVNTINKATKTSIVGSGGDWADVVPQVLYGYSRRDLAPISSPLRTVYGINLRMLENEAVALFHRCRPSS